MYIVNLVMPVNKVYGYNKSNNLCVLVTSTNGEEIKMEALNRELSRVIRARLDLNIYHLMDEVLNRIRIRMTKPEIDSFINRKVKNNLKLEVSDDSNVVIEYRMRK